MHKGDLDSYIARFKHLAEVAGYNVDESATVQIFARGLLPQLADACLDKDNSPNTMQEWIDAAKIEQQKYANKVTFSHQRQGKWLLPTGWNKKSFKPQR